MPRVRKAQPLPKFDLQTILRVASTLKESDADLFQKVMSELTTAPKKSRARIVAGLVTVFGAQ